MITQERCDAAADQWGNLPPEEQSDGEELLRSLLHNLRRTNRRSGYVHGRGRNIEPRDPRLDRWLAGEDMAAVYPAH